MADQNWYYAKGDEKVGPISDQQLRSLLGSGSLKPQDLVWREGMSSWAPINQVPGLAPTAANLPAAKPSAAGPPTPPAAAQAATAPAGRSLSARAASLAAKWQNPLAYGHSFGQPLLLVGLFFVLLAKGCDGIGMRGVGRSEAQSELARSRFSDEWDQKKFALHDRQRKTLQEHKPLLEKAKKADRFELDLPLDMPRVRPSSRNRYRDDATPAMIKSDDEGPATRRRSSGDALFDEVQRTLRAELSGEDVTKLNSLKTDWDKAHEELDKLEKDRTTQSYELERTTWRDLDIAARDAKVDNQLWGYWREQVFVLGSLLLSVGLLAVGFTGEGAQRWICLIMLAIVTFSLYVGGAAWISSVVGAFGGRF